MCTSPIEIYNKKLFITKYDKVKHTVPCNRCWSCMRQKQDDYFVKAYYLFMMYRDKSGFAFFDTLTFNEDCVPVDNNGNRCFSLEVLREFRLMLYFIIEKYLLKHFAFSDAVMTPVQRKQYMETFNVDCTTIKFSKRVRSLSWTEKKYIVHALMRDNLDYLITSEFGHNTHRPHYHILIFCSLPDITFWQIARWIKSSWSFGFTDSRYTVKNRVVGADWTDFANQFDRAIGYVTKYVTKDILNYCDYDVDMSDCKQRVVSSHGFDRAVMALLDDETIKKGFRIYRSKIQDYRDYKVPLSCVNKYYYYREKVDLGDDKIHYVRHFNDAGKLKLKEDVIDTAFWKYWQHLCETIHNGSAAGFDVDKYNEISNHIDIFQYAYETYYYIGRFRFAAGKSTSQLLRFSSASRNYMYDDRFVKRASARANSVHEMFRYSDPLFYALDKLVKDAFEWQNNNKQIYFDMLEKQKESIVNNLIQ